MRVHFLFVRVVGLFDISHHILRTQIKNPAHPLDHSADRLAAAAFNVPMVRARIAQASAHAMNFTATHSLKTLS